MPTEPTHRVHRLLRQYARQRQDQAGSVARLDPSARARLQAEVARAFGPDGPIEPARPYALSVPSLWPRLLWGGASAAVLIGLATLFLRTDTERQRHLAQVDKLQFFPSGAGALSVPSGGPAVAENVRRFQLGHATPAGQTVPPQTKAPVVRAPQALAPELPKPNLALALPRSETEPEEWASNAPRFAYGLTPAREPAAAGDDSKAVEEQADALAPTTAMASAAPAGAPPRSQNNLLFQQDRSRYRQNRNSPPLPSVLSRFEVQPAGTNVRIVDADGSIYAGAAAPAATEAQPFSFRAAGTNVTLNQLVVFTGAFEPSSNLVLTDQIAALQAQNVDISATAATSPRANAETPAVRSLSLQNASPSASNNLSQQGRIQGQAIVGGKDQLNIEAQQISP